MNFLEKLDFLMNKYGLNKRTLSQKSQIPYTTIDNWYKRGYEGLKLPTLLKLNDFFNTKLDFWILDEITDPNYGKSSGFEVAYEEMEHIKKYRTLDDIGRNHVDTVMEWETDRIKMSTNETKTKKCGIIPMRLISYYYKNASAGTGELIIDTLPEKDIEIPDIPEYRNVSYAIGVNGNSMEPVYHDGDILLVEATSELKIGDIGIFLIGSECYVKKMGETELISLNKDYDNIPLDESARIWGKVIDTL